MAFGLLNMPAFQEYAKDIIIKELGSKIGTELGIGKLHFRPFSTVELDSVYLYDQSHEKTLIAEKLSAGIDLLALVRGNIVITSAHLSDFEVHLSKENSQSPLNIQYIIDAFKPEENKPKSNIKIAVNTINISNGQFYYNVKDKPEKGNVFDANHVAVSDLNAKFTLKSIESDSLNIQVKKISLKERSGFEISNLVFRLVTQDKKVSIRGFNLDMPSSNLVLSKCELDLTPTVDSASIVDYATLDCVIAPSLISPKDVAALVPALHPFEKVIAIQGEISGNIDDVMVSNFSVDYNSQISLLANVEVKDIKEPKKMYVLGSIDNLVLNSGEIENIINNFSKNKIKLPSQIKELGTISFEGDISGYLNQLTAFGSLETKLGIIQTDVLFGFNPRNGIDTYAKGKIYTSEFEIGELLNNADLDKISLNLSVDMEKPSHGKIKGNAKGEIHDFGFKGHTYDDISLDVAYNGLQIDGKLNVNDFYGMVDIAGLFDLTDKEKPILNFKTEVKDLQPAELHLANNMENTQISFIVDANFVGKDIDNAEGYVKIDSLDFIRDDKTFRMDRFLLEVSGQSNDRTLRLRSNLINGILRGAYSTSSVVQNVQQTLRPYLPAIIKQENKIKPDDKDNIFAFDFQINNTDTLSNILKLPFTILSQAKVVGAYNNVLNKFNLEVFAPAIKVAGMNIQSGYVAIKNPNDTINATIKALVTGKNNTINDITIASKVNNNRIGTDISLTNDGAQKAKGNFYISTFFAENEYSPLSVDIEVLPSELLLNNANWKMNKSNISIQDGSYAIKNFLISNKQDNQEIKINGRYSPKNPRDILKAELKNINLEYIFQTLAIDALQFGGLATGSLFVSTIESKPYANTRLDVTDFKFNGTELGKLNIFSELDEETNTVVLDGLILSKENKRTKVDGSLDPIKQELSIYFDADSVDVSFLNKYASAVFQNISGRGTGKVHLFGDFSDVTVEGKAFVQDGSLGINFLNTKYSFTDTIFLKKDLIYFTDLELYDAYNNKAIASGKVSHNFFHDFTYLVDLSANKFLLYNATQAHNPIFYGKAFGSGSGTIVGDENAVDIDIRMRTEDKTLVRMNFMEDFINEYSFINYKSKENKDSIKELATASPTTIKTESGMAINMNFYIDATPDAVVELVMDPSAGDILRGSGSGAMQFHWSSKDSPRLFGTYNITRGSYNFTFQRILERRFTIQEGSNVQFRGDPFEATLDVNAMYKVNASLNDLDKFLAQTAGQSTIPVNCVLNLTGQLRRPNIGLDVKFPSADPEIERQVKNIINTEDEINKQVAYLLILSKFKAPHGANVDNPTSDFAAVASATLSNQLTKIVSQIDDRWQLGTNIRYNDREMTYTEAEVLLSRQLFNDRLIINGNFGYRNDLNINKEAMVHDVDIEYLLNRAGTWRVKAYNHYNEKFYYTQQATQTQGFGIIYKKDFDKLRDLFGSRRKRLVPINDTITPILPDSTKKGSPLSHFIRMKK